jgi:ribosomal protein S18 acetylase RimI-like enzyme
MEIVSINAENLAQHPGAICFINPKNPSFPLKIEWIKQRFSEGLRIKLLYTDDRKKVAGFIEYVPGEYAWRAVSANGYMFIHCLWIYPNENKNKGFGTQLIEECIEDARQNNCNGVVVVTSKNAFMANSSLFLKNGFREIANDGAGNELLVLN